MEEYIVSIYTAMLQLAKTIIPLRHDFCFPLMVENINNVCKK